MPMKLVFIELHWRNNKGLLLRGGWQIFQFRNSKNFLIKGNQVCFKDWDDFWGAKEGHLVIPCATSFIRGPPLKAFAIPLFDVKVPSRIPEGFVVSSQRLADLDWGLLLIYGTTLFVLYPCFGSWICFLEILAGYRLLLSPLLHIYSLRYNYALQYTYIVTLIAGLWMRRFSMWEQIITHGL